jgi:hypothetical protein
MSWRRVRNRRAPVQANQPGEVIPTARTVIATALVGVGVSLVAAPVASADPVDCRQTPCTLQDIQSNWGQAPSQVVTGWSQLPGQIPQGVSSWANAPGQVVQGWSQLPGQIPQGVSNWANAPGQIVQGWAHLAGR